MKCNIIRIISVVLMAAAGLACTQPTVPAASSADTAAMTASDSAPGNRSPTVHTDTGMNNQPYVLNEVPGPDYQPVSAQELIRMQAARDSEAMVIERRNAAARERRTVPPVVTHVRHDLDRLSPRLRSLADVIVKKTDGRDTTMELPSLNFSWPTGDHATSLYGDTNTLSFMAGSLHITVMIYDSPAIAIQQALRPHARWSLAPDAMIDNPVGPNSTLFRYANGADIWAAKNGVFVQVTLQRSNISQATTENHAKAILTEIFAFLRSQEN